MFISETQFIFQKAILHFQENCKAQRSMYQESKRDCE